MLFYNVKQGTREWLKLRLGVPSASNFKKIVTPGGKLSKSADGYIAELIGERMSLLDPDGAENFVSRAMQHGINTEAEARRYYCMERRTTVVNGGWCLTDDGRFGCSPDFLVGLTDMEGTPLFPVFDLEGEPSPPCPEGHILLHQNEYCRAKVVGAGELKCPIEGGIQIERVLEGVFPNEFRPQCAGHMIVTGAGWCDFESYHPGITPLLARIEPDAYTDLLRAALDVFWTKYQEALEKVKALS